MKFIIEDDERDIISQFFMSAYPDEVSREFIYVQGDGNLVEKVKYLLSSTDEMLLVLIDMIPDNTNTVRIYRNLRTLSRQNNGRVIVLPIVCAEYYLVTSLVNTGVIIDETGVDICINKDFWHNSLLINTQKDRMFCKNFEKYCKLILIKNLKYCAKHSGKDSKYYAAYYFNDCLCRFKNVDTDNLCEQYESKEAKSIRFIKQYPYFPAGSIAKNMDQLNISDIWSIHRKLVGEFNNMVAYYKKMDTTGNKKYSFITAIC